MIICVCRKISSRQIDYHQDCGARTPADIFTAQGCQPQCGRCLPKMADMLGTDDRAEAAFLMAAE